MAENSFGWDNWTGTGVNDADSLAAEIDRIKKWQRTHSGIDFAAAGPDYPHPSQKVRTLYFFGGNGRLNEDGLQFLTFAEGKNAISWVQEYMTTPLSSYPTGNIYGNNQSGPDTLSDYVEVIINSRAVAGSTSFLAVRATDDTLVPSAVIQETVGEGETSTLSLRAELSSLAEGRALELENAPFHLIGETSDFATLADGMLWYRSDTDKFRARANGVTENLAFESSIPTTMNKQPFAAKTTTYTTTANDGVITADATSASFTITLVASSGNAGLTQTFKKINATNVVTIDGNSSETIDGLATYALSAQWSWVTLVCTGSSWLITGAG